MDINAIEIIVGLVVGAIAAAKKKSSTPKDTGTLPPSQDTTPAGQPVLTEADRRYREVQEEIRRRIAQKNQNTPGRPAMAAPNPVQNYKRSRQSTDPIPMNRDFGSRKPKKAVVAPPPPLQAPKKTVAVQPVMADAPAPEAAPAYPSEAAAYALTKDSSDNAVPSTSSGISNALRAILASPNAARQAYLLREIFAEPLSLRPTGNGGHDDWN